MSAPRVFFYVQHLLGIGHTVRAAALTRAMRRAGMDVVYVSGGFDALDTPLMGARVVRLPPARTKDASFKTLLGEDGRPVDDRWRVRRRAALLDAFHAAAPDIVLIETFPFGRWQFRFELLPLLDAARGRARIVCSLRDILVPKRNPDRLAAIVDIVRDYFDLVLVHGDPDLVRLEATFAPAASIAAKLRYTGYVALDKPASGPAPGPAPTEPDVVVAAGGGGAGGALMRAALAARPSCVLHDRPWRFLIGPNLPPDDVAALRVAPGVTIDPVRPDYRALLAASALSISQAGYNTVMDLLLARARSVVVPFSTHGQSEQALRAGLLAERGWLCVADEATLTPERLAAAIDRAAAAPRPDPHGLDLDGARRSAALIARLAGAATNLVESQPVALRSLDTAI